MTDPKRAPKKLPGWVWGGLIGCTIVMTWMGWHQPGHRDLVRLFGNGGNLNCVQEASRIYATRLGPQPGLPEAPSRLEDYIAIAEPVELPPELAARLKTLLTSPRSYQWGVAVACNPLYGYRLRFQCDGTPVEMWVCLKCSQIEVVVDGHGVGGGLFTPIARELRALSVELFPDDTAIEQAAR